MWNDTEENLISMSPIRSQVQILYSLIHLFLYTKGHCDIGSITSLPYRTNIFSEDITTG